MLGLAGGFKVANLQYHREQSVAKNREIANATRGMPGLQQGSQAEVSAILEKAKANPNDFDAQFDAADQFFTIGRPQDALNFLEQAKKVNPNDWRVSAGFGVAYLMMDDYDRAIEFLKRAREQKADNPGVTLALVDLYIKTRRNLDEAEILLKELESQGAVDTVKLGQFRAELDAARKNKVEAPAEKNGETMKPQTTLSHGPEQERPKVTK
jgi:tetratricopeptide (TPR) repeat protein